MRAYSLFSELYHFLTYSRSSPCVKLENGMLIISIDVDVGSGKLGLANRGANDSNVNSSLTEYQVGKIEENALPLFLRTFEEFEIPATFALRGQLHDIDNSFLKLLLASSVKHDIGAHGYSHRAFTSLSKDEADYELKKTSLAMRKYNVIPKSFVFPKNKVSHLDLLVKYGYKCFRSIGGFRFDCMCIERKAGLYDVHPSLYLTQDMGSMLQKRILDIAVAKKAPLHLWFHLWSFGGENDLIQVAIDKSIKPFLEYARKRRQEGLLRFETMLSAVEEVEKKTGGLQRSACDRELTRSEAYAA